MRFVDRARPEEKCRGLRPCPPSHVARVEYKWLEIDLIELLTADDSLSPISSSVLCWAVSTLKFGLLGYYFY
jgi:hypothetical protein